MATPDLVEVQRRDLPRRSVAATGKVQITCRDATGAFATIERDEDSAAPALRVYAIWLHHVPTERELADVRSLIGRVCATLHDRVPGVAEPAREEFIGIKRERALGHSLDGAAPH